MRLALLTATLLASTVAANAGTISFQFSEDAGPPTVINSGLATSTQTNVTVGDFTIDQVTGTTQPAVLPPVVLNSNELSVTATSGVSHTLHIFVTAQGLDTTGVQLVESDFDAVGLTTGWTAHLASFFSPTNALFGGTALATADFTGTDHSTSKGFFDLGPGPLVSYTAEYDITTNGVAGDSNLGVNITAVPGPTLGAGIPGVVAAAGLLLVAARRRKEKLA
jgi:hypothetical protein